MLSPSEVMNRRSSRLDSQGYYNDEGEPLVCYKECVQRIFRRRRKYPQSSRQGSMRDSDSDSEGYSSCSTSVRRNQNTTNDGNSKTFSFSYLICSLCVLVLLCLVFAFLILTQGRNFLSTGPSERPINIDTVKRLEEMEKLLRMQQEKLLRMQQEKLPRMQQEKLLMELQDRLIPMADTLPNFALETQGASIIPSHCSPTYRPPSCMKIFGIPLFQPPRDPRIVIQGHLPLKVGLCWPFPGDRGHLSIALSHPVTITHVTLSHVSKNVHPSGTIKSAPQEFSVFGMNTLDEEGTLLGTFLYDHDGDQVQTFKLPEHKQSVFNYVKLQVLSNWGHPDYTCLYNFRIHGMLQNQGDEAERMRLSSGCRWDHKLSVFNYMKLQVVHLYNFVHGMLQNQEGDV